MHQRRALRFIRHTLLVGVEGLGEDFIASENHDDGKILVDQGQNTMLQLTRHDGLAVKVGDFLDLESTLQGSRELATSAQEQQTLLVLEGSGAEILDWLVKLQDLLYLIRDLSKAVHDILASLLLRCAILAQRQSKHDHGNEL